jgi:SMODS and SLOG-associating 2TM effector domain 1
MDLVDYWVVGFSGKRQLANSGQVRSAIAKLLEEIKSLTRGQLVALSSAAIGSDLLFAQEATRLGIAWICILPFPADAFFNQRDFPDESERTTARAELGAAADVEVIRTPQSPAELENSIWRRAAFAEAGFRCVDGADVVIAVASHAETRGKTGGTADILAHARAARRPVIVIDPETIEIYRENWPPNLHDRVSEELSALPPGKVSEKERAMLPTSAALKVAECRSGFARAARRHVPGIRWWTTAVVVLHGLATILTAAVLLRAFEFSELTKSLLERTAFAFIAIGFASLVVLLAKQPQKRAANYRLAAEIGRSILGMWSVPQAATEIVRSVPRELDHLARNLLLAERLDPQRNRNFDRLTPDEVNQLALGYATNRIAPQITYYGDKCRRARHWGRGVEICSLLLSLTAFVCAAALALAPHGLNVKWGFAKLAAATAAPVMVSLLVIHEIKRREARYDEMQESLGELHQKILNTRTLTLLRDLVVDAERLLLNECHDWWVLARANVAA